MDLGRLEGLLHSLRPEDDSLDGVKERRVEKGSGPGSTLLGCELSVFSHTRIGHPFNSILTAPGKYRLHSMASLLVFSICKYHV